MKNNKEIHKALQESGLFFLDSSDEKQPRTHENTDDRTTWYEYNEDHFFIFLDDVERFYNQGKLLTHFKAYGLPIYYIVITNFEPDSKEAKKDRAIHARL